MCIKHCLQYTFLPLDATKSHTMGLETVIFISLTSSEIITEQYQVSGSAKNQNCFLLTWKWNSGFKIKNKIWTAVNHGDPTVRLPIKSLTPRQCLLQSAQSAPSTAPTLLPNRQLPPLHLPECMNKQTNKQKDYVRRIPYMAGPPRCCRHVHWHSIKEKKMKSRRRPPRRLLHAPCTVTPLLLHTCSNVSYWSVAPSLRPPNKPLLTPSGRVRPICVCLRALEIA